MHICLGAQRGARHRQAFADGALTVCSRKGVHPSEEALLNALPTGRSGAALVINSSAALAGLALRALNPDLGVHCHFDDAWDFALAQANVKPQRRLAPRLGLGPDPPEGPWDIVALPFHMSGVAELVHERLAFALKCLRPGGLLFTSTDHRSDRFLRNAVVELFGSATTVPGPTRRSGVAYIARRPRAPKLRERDFRRTFTVREGEGTLSFVSRPGVFCHGRLDEGTRALLAALDVGPAKRVLDLGCGVGVLGLIAALRSPESRVTLVDSHARAIECARANAAALGVESRCQAFVSAEPLRGLAPGFDLVVSNPPYYGHYRIAEMFLDTAAQVLAPGGRILLVTKDPDWFAEAMGQRLRQIERTERRGYWVMRATQPSRAEGGTVAPAPSSRQPSGGVPGQSVAPN